MINMASGEGSSDGKDSTAKSSPRDARAMKAILKEMGVENYEARVINQMLEFTYRYVTDVLEDAKVYSNHANKKEIDAEDVKLAVQIRMDHSFTSPPPRDFLMEIARQKNSTPLPPNQPRSGLRLPPDRYCLLSNNYRVKQQKKQQPSRPVPIVPARTMPHYPMSVSSSGIKVSQPTINITSVKSVSAAGLSPVVSLPVKTSSSTKLVSTAPGPTSDKPILSTTLVTQKPQPTPTTVQQRAQAGVGQPSASWQQTKSSSTSAGSATSAPQSMTTVSALPSMDETVASSLQQQALVTSLKRKREGEEEDDYDS